MKRTKVGLTELERRLLTVLRSVNRPISATEIAAWHMGATTSSISAAMRRLARKGHARARLQPVYSAAKRRAP